MTPPEVSAIGDGRRCVSDQELAFIYPGIRACRRTVMVGHWCAANPHPLSPGINIFVCQRPLVSMAGVNARCACQLVGCNLLYRRSNTHDAGHRLRDKKSETREDVPKTSHEFSSRHHCPVVLQVTQRRQDPVPEHFW